jgi:hypothetical protein
MHVKKLCLLITSINHLCGNAYSFKTANPLLGTILIHFHPVHNFTIFSIRTIFILISHLLLCYSRGFQT